MATLKNWIAQAKKEIDNYPQEVKQDLAAIAAHSLGLESSAYTALYLEKELSLHEFNTLNKNLTRRIKGEPFAYITGKKEFWSIDFIVNHDVLIPRPDSETILEVIKKSYEKRKREFFYHQERRSTDKKISKIKIIDLGTGSGALIISAVKEAIKHNLPVEGWAVDICPKALNVAQKNAKLNAVDNLIKFIQSSWWEEVPHDLTFDYIISNPPYISHEEFLNLSPAVKDYEPSQALTDYSDGLSNYPLILEQGADRLRDHNSIILLECGLNQAKKIISLTEKYPIDEQQQKDVIHHNSNKKLYRKLYHRIFHDIEGRERVIAIKNNCFFDD